MKKLIKHIGFIFLGLGANSQRYISNISDIQSELTNTNGTLDVKLSGNYSLYTPILVPANTELRVSSSDGAQIVCENRTFAFDVSSGSTLDITGISIKNCVGSAIRTDSSVLTVSNCVFDNNKNATLGGAIFAMDSDVTVEDTLFSENVANQGGSVYLIADGRRSASFDNCSFLYNSAAEMFPPDYSISFPLFTGGGAIAVEDIDVSVTRSIFTGNHASQSGGGIAISDNSSLVVSYCYFDSNTVGKFGAGISGPNVEIRNSSFTNNTSDQDGGGVYTWGASYMDDMICDHNTALDKGGCLYTRGETVLGTNITMIGNTGYFGGSVYTAFGADVAIYGGYYANSTATRNGGFMYISDGGRVEMYNATVEYCSAVRRAAVAYVSGTSDDMIEGRGGGRLHIHDGVFRHNSVGELGGGFVVWGRSTSFVISGGVYSDNYSLYAGGLLFLEQFATFEASNCLFENNLSDDQGGAIYARDPNYISVSCTSINNQSPQASYIYITHSVETSYISNSSIVHSDSGSSDVIYIANSVVVIDSVDMEELDENTQTIAIKQNKDSIVTLTNSSFRGWYGESVITSLNPGDNTTAIIECDFRDTFAYHTVVSQSKVLIINACINNNTLFGSENYDLLAVNSFTCEDYEICRGCIDNELGVLCTCSPLRCHLGSEVEFSVSQEPNRNFYYPEVVDFYINVVNDDTDSIIWEVDESSNTSITEITPGSGIIKPGERVSIYVKMPPETGTFDTLFAVTGPSIIEKKVIPITHTLYRCGKFEIEVVVDDVVTCTPCANYLNYSNGEIGYDCARDGITVEQLPIKPGFWRSSAESLDIFKCNVKSVCRGGSQIENSDSYCETGNVGPYCAVCAHGYTKRADDKCIKCGKKQAGLVSIGILIVVLSVILASIVFLFLINRLVFIKSVITCHTSNTGTNNRKGLILKTVRDNSHKIKILVVVWQILVVFPEIVNVTYPETYSTVLQWMKICMTFFSFNLDFLSSSCILPSLDHYSKLVITTISPIAIFFILIGTYFLSIKINGTSRDSVSTTWTRHISVGLIITFLIFTSTSTVIFKTFVCDVDVFPGRGFLRADYSIECFTMTHTLYRIYAGVMILVYPLGIPFLYFVLLYRKKDVLLQDNAERKENDTVIPFRFLWKDFKPKVYFFEVIECMRRILLTGFLVFVKPGSSIQVTVACLFAFTSLAVFELIRPHYNKTDAWLYRLGCIIIFISSYMGLLLKIDFESQQSVLEIILILLNVVLVIAIIGSIILSVYTHDHDLLDVSSILRVKKRTTPKG